MHVPHQSSTECHRITNKPSALISPTSRPSDGTVSIRPSTMSDSAERNATATRSPTSVKVKSVKTHAAAKVHIDETATDATLMTIIDRSFRRVLNRVFV